MNRVQNHHALFDRRDVSPGICRRPGSPRQIRNIASVAIYFISSITAFNSLGMGGSGRFSTCISPSGPALDDDVVLAPFRILVGKVFAKLRAPALLSKQRGAGNGLGHDQKIREIHGGVPPVVVLSMAWDTCPICARPKLGDNFQRVCISPSVRTMPTRFCIDSCNSY